MKLFFAAVAALLILSSPDPEAVAADLGKAIVIGSGQTKVIEFTDPDCPFCRKASKYFSSRQDVTRYVFFYPLARHPRAREKAASVLSQPDRAKAYSAVMSGSLDSAPMLPAVTAKGEKLLEDHIAEAKRTKVDSTPTFMINGRFIEGFDLKKIEEALGPAPR